MSVEEPDAEPLESNPVALGESEYDSLSSGLLDPVPVVLFSSVVLNERCGDEDWDRDGVREKLRESE